MRAASQVEQAERGAVGLSRQQQGAEDHEKEEKRPGFHKQKVPFFGLFTNTNEEKGRFIARNEFFLKTDI